MSGSKLEELVEHRDTILPAEIGALIHDLGKLHRLFVEQHAMEYTGKKKYAHGNVLEDIEKADELKEIAEKVKNLLERCKAIDSNLYEIVKRHHNKDQRESLPVLVKLAIASDEFDSAEDRGGAKDQQSLCATFKASAFGYESEINLDELEELRKKVYRELIRF